MGRLSKITHMLIFMLTALPASAAGEKMAISETVGFITSVLNGCGEIVGQRAPESDEFKHILTRHRFQWESVTVTKGVLEVSRWVLADSINNSLPEAERHVTWPVKKIVSRAKLADLSPDVVVMTDDHGVRLVKYSCTSGACLTYKEHWYGKKLTPYPNDLRIDKVRKSGEGPQTGTTPSVENSDLIAVCSDEVAGRVQRAMGHLIKSGGGKKSPF